MKPPFVRSPYNYDTNEHSEATGLKCQDPTLTQQQFKEESDINFIADRYGLTGELPQVLKLPSYGDFTGIFDFQTAQNQVVQAQREFMTLPAKTRARFNNDPQKLLEFLGDPENRSEAEFLGLVTKEKTNESRTTEIPHRTTQERTGTARAEENQAETLRPEEP